MLLPDSFLNIRLWSIFNEFVFSRAHSLPYIYSCLVNAMGISSWLHFLTETILANRRAEITANSSKPSVRKKNCPREAREIILRNHTVSRQKSLSASARPALLLTTLDVPDDNRISDLNGGVYILQESRKLSHIVFYLFVWFFEMGFLCVT